jgi:hypothetical protein
MDPDLILEPGMCVFLPTNEHYVVSGLSPSVSVMASLYVGVDGAGFMQVNDINVTEGYAFVSNDDKIRINVCSSDQYGGLLSYILRIGNVQNSVVVNSHPTLVERGERVYSLCHTANLGSRTR